MRILQVAGYDLLDVGVAHKEGFGIDHPAVVDLKGCTAPCFLYVDVSELYAF